MTNLNESLFALEHKLLVRADSRNVYSIVRGMDRYSEYMPFVKKIDTTSISQNRFSSNWEIEIDGAPIFWKQENSFDDTKLEMRFRMLEGDFESYEGVITVDVFGVYSLLNLTACFNWGIPSFSKIVGPVLEQQANRAMRGMMIAFKRRAERK